MPDNIKNPKPSRVIPILIAAGVEVVVLILVVVPVGIILSSGNENIAALGIILLYALFGIAVSVGVLAALIQRLQEIKKGEESDAKRY